MGKLAWVTGMGHHGYGCRYSARYPRVYPCHHLFMGIAFLVPTNSAMTYQVSPKINSGTCQAENQGIPWSSVLSHCFFFTVLAMAQKHCKAAAACGQAGRAQKNHSQ